MQAGTDHPKARHILLYTAYDGYVQSVRQRECILLLHLVVQYKLLHNEQMAAADFDQQVLDWFLQIIVWLGKVDKEMEQDHVNSLTPTLKNSSEWLKFECQVHAQMQTHHSPVLKHSLLYVIHPHDEVTHEMLDDDYLSST
jgi:hypothetical protein